MTHRFIPNTEKVREEMLEEMGRESVEELFSDIPPECRFEGDLEIPKMTESELRRHLKSVLSKNSPYTESISFLGGGVWPHHVPSHVENLVKRSEFLTSYTPYQAEASQGLLQALFEYQSLISELVGLDVANSSMYDWASALGEAALMTARLTDGNKFLVPELISPGRLSVLMTYAEGPDLKIEKVSQDPDSGQLVLSDLEEKLDDETAGVYIENPNYLGQIEKRVDEIGEMVKKGDTLFVVGTNPISLGLLKPPGDYGADIVVGEGQPLGIPAHFGGPSLGIFACRNERKFLRQVPGRLVGMAEEQEDKRRGFTQVLQTREQHIRRKNAASNICTNQALNAVAAAIYLSSMGTSGLQKVSKKCAGNARYALKRMREIDGVNAPLFDAPYFNEFVVTFENSSKSGEKINSELLQRGIHGGKPLQKEFPRFGESSLWCFTELHTEGDIDWMIDSLRDILEGES